MSHNIALLTPSAFLDSSCYSAEGLCEPFQRRLRPIPSVFDSDDYVDECTESESIFSPSITSQSLSSSPVSTNTATTQPALLPPLPGRKPPRPALPRPLNVTAYTRPSHYDTYIKTVLTPSAINAASSSLTTIAEAETRHSADHMVIANEIMNQRTNAPSTWIREVVFPREALPDNFKEVFRNSSIWDKHQETFRELPSNLVEEDMEHWLNHIVHILGVAFEKFTTGETPEGIYPEAFDAECNRSWDIEWTSNEPTVDTHDRKPDLSLLDRTSRTALSHTGGRPGWPIIQAFAEIAPSKGTFAHVVWNIVEKAYLMFESQPYRRYVIALGFFGPIQDATWALVLVDRSGVVSSSQFPLKGPDGITLGQVLYCLSFAKPTYIGIDETMTICKLTGVVTHITVTGQTPTSEKERSVKRIFEIVRLLHSTSKVSGRATGVWLVRRKGRYYILKDSWPLETEPFSEIRHLLKINQTILNDTKMHDTLKHTYPVLVVGQELYDSTDVRRSEIPEKPLPRVHRRIVTKPIGDPLTSFRNKYELCSVLCDVVAFLKYSAETCRICHGDISLKNIVINRIWDDDNGDDDTDHDDIDDIDIDSITSSNSSSDNVALDVVMNENGASEIADHRKVYTTCDSSNLELTSPVDSSTALISSGAIAATSQPSSPNTRPWPIEAHGLVIDNDSSFSLDDVAKLDYRVKLGTLPFMALDALKWDVASDFTHQPKHDLESLFYVLITLCTYTNGPGCLRSSIPGVNELSVCLNEWFTTHDHHVLARHKGAQLSSFDEYVLRRLPPYWNDFHQVLTNLHSVLWPKECAVLNQPNAATHEAFLEVLTKAREMYRQQEDEAYTFAPIPEKRAHPSGLQKRKENGGDVGEGAKRRKTAHPY